MTAVFEIRVSTGAEIMEPGSFALYLWCEDDENLAVGYPIIVLTEAAATVEQLDVAAAESLATEFVGELDWEKVPLDRQDTDEAGGYAIMRARRLTARGHPAPR